MWWILGLAAVGLTLTWLLIGAGEAGKVIDDSRFVALGETPATTGQLPNSV